MTEAENVSNTLERLIPQLCFFGNLNEQKPLFQKVDLQKMSTFAKAGTLITTARVDR